MPSLPAPLALLALAIVARHPRAGGRAGAGRPVRPARHRLDGAARGAQPGARCRTAPAAAPGPGWRPGCSRSPRSAGYAAGPHLPGADADARVVARSAVTPPFDVAQYPSPLAGFRRYTEPNVAGLWDQDLLRVQGLPGGHAAALRHPRRLRRRRLGRLQPRQQRHPGAGDGLPAGRLAGGGPRCRASRCGCGSPCPRAATATSGCPPPARSPGSAFDGGRADQLASRLWLNVDTSTGDRARPARRR